jgi:hypothetical protein
MPLVPLVIALIVAAGACRSDPVPPPSSTSPTVQSQAKWPEKLADFRFRWSADPSFDLATGWAVPLRAYLESWLVVFYTGDPNAGYPGYDRATPPVLARTDPKWYSTPTAQREIRSYRDISYYDVPNQRIVGNEDLHLVRVEPVATGFRAFVCDSTFDVYVQQGGAPRFSPLNLESSVGANDGDYHNMKVWRIEFSNKDSRVGASPPASPTAPQHGPLPAPHDDVFGPWFVTGATEVAAWFDSDFPGLTPGNPDYTQRENEAGSTEDAIRQQCLDGLPMGVDQRAETASTVIDKPPAVEPAVPGWPE